jgi:cephalosporin hydroxylase
MINPLETYFYSNRKNIVHKWAHYLDIYHQHFNRFVGTECVVVEIGVSQGGSLQMWKNYFGEKAIIYGLDINPYCKEFEEENIHICIGSQSDRKFLKDLKSKIPKIDILIDDGGHTMEQQITSFEELFDHVKEDGVYLCEDLHTSYWEEFGGGLNKPTTFIEFSKRLIDQLNAWHIRNDELPVSDFTRSSNSLHFYDSVLVIEKKKRFPPWNEKRGEENHLMISINERSFDFFKLKLHLLGVDLDNGIDYGHAAKDPILLEALLNERFEGKSWPKTGDTMIGYKRLSNIEFCLIDIIRKNIPGDCIETGVWRGGACIFMRAILKSYGISEKTVWVADSFQGLPKPNPDVYPEDFGDELHTFTELSITQDEVIRNFRKYDLWDHQVKILKGWFKDTISSAPIEKLSLLRLDGDMYESTIDVLYYLYPKLSLGGYCIVDDWGAVKACKKAVEDYRRAFNIQEEIQVIDWTGIFWKKETEHSIIPRHQFNELNTNKT